MREIKFRIWCKQNESMQRVSKIGFDEGKLWYVLDEDHETQPPYFEDDDDWVLMQYTGLKDKNGKEIYEGDIVKTHDQNNVIKYEYGSFLVKGLHADEYERTYSVLYHYLVDATIPDMPHSRFDGVTTTLEVIGNIYENPKLLEGIA